MGKLEEFGKMYGAKPTAHENMRVCHKSVTHPFLFFHLSSNTKKENFIFIYNKAQTFTSSGFVFPQKSISLQKTF